MKNSESDIVDIEAQLSFTVMIYERNQVCYLIGFAEYTRFFWWTYNKITDNLYIYYDYQVILLTF